MYSILGDRVVIMLVKKYNLNDKDLFLISWARLFELLKTISQEFALSMGVDLKFLWDPLIWYSFIPMYIQFVYNRILLEEYYLGKFLSPHPLIE